MTQRLHLRHRIEEIPAGPIEELAQLIRLEIAAIGQVRMDGVLKGCARAEGAVPAIEPLGVAHGAHLVDKAAPPRGHAGLVAQAHSSCQLDEHPVELVAYQEVPQVPASIAKVVLTRQVEVDHTDGLVGPIAHLGASHHDLSAAAPTKLHQGGGRVLRAAAVSPDDLATLCRDLQQVALGSR